MPKMQKNELQGVDYVKSGFFQPTLEEIRRAKFEQALDVMVRIAMRLVKKEMEGQKGVSANGSITSH